MPAWRRVPMNAASSSGCAATSAGQRCRRHACRSPQAKAGRGRGARRSEAGTPAERRASMSWAQRLKRVFKIDIETCPACGGAMRIIACIEDPLVIEKILAHLDAKAAAAQAARPPPSRAPPEARSSGEPTGAAQVA
jgi:hypothetical protein